LTGWSDPTARVGFRTATNLYLARHGGSKRSAASVDKNHFRFQSRSAAAWRAGLVSRAFSLAVEFVACRWVPTRRRASLCVRHLAAYGRVMASTTVEIARPPADVFAFVADPTKLSAWQDVEEVQQLTDGPV
jgi:hypothetical protein